MDTSSFVGLTLVGVPISAFYMYRTRKETHMTGGKRLLGFVIFFAAGLLLLSYAHGAFEAGHIPCGRYGRLDCDEDSDPFSFWAKALFVFIGGIFSLAGAIVALIRPDSAGNSDGA